MTPMAPRWVLDFNVPPERQNDYPEHCCKLVTDEQRIEPGEVFLAPIVSRLPYAISTRFDFKADNGVMLDHERLIGLTVRLTCFKHTSGMLTQMCS